jgi:hypothetical protein
MNINCGLRKVCIIFKVRLAHDAPAQTPRAGQNRRNRCHAPSGRKAQSRRQGQSRASVSSYPAPRRICEDPLSRIEEEHRGTLHAISAALFVDGARQIDDDAGMSAPATKVKALLGRKEPRRAATTDGSAANFSCDAII